MDKRHHRKRKKDFGVDESQFVVGGGGARGLVQGQRTDQGSAATSSLTAGRFDRPSDSRPKIARANSPAPRREHRMVRQRLTPDAPRARRFHRDDGGGPGNAPDVA